MTDPIGDIENSHGNRSLGAFAVQVYIGALDEANGDAQIALASTIAILTATFKANPLDTDA